MERLGCWALYVGGTELHIVLRTKRRAADLVKAEACRRLLAATCHRHDQVSAAEPQRRRRNRAAIRG